MCAKDQLCFLKVIFLVSFIFLSCSKQETIFFDIPEGNADETLTAFASQASKEFIFSSEELTEVTTNRIYGMYTLDEALQLLLEGTSLKYARDEESGAIAVWQDNPQKIK